MKSLKKDLIASLRDDDSEENRKNWVQHIIEADIPLPELADIVTGERKAAMRFIWLVGDLCDRVPQKVFPAVSYFFSARDKVLFPNYDRSLAKMFWLAGVPEELEGEAIDTMFKWLLDPSVIVSTKAYSLSAPINVHAIPIGEDSPIGCISLPRVGGGNCPINTFDMP